MRTKVRISASLVALAGGLLLMVVPVIAHHAFAAEFDRDKPVTLKGKTTVVEWVNPHAWIHMEVKEPDGKLTTWMVECGAPNALIRRGFTKDSLPVGLEILVTGYRAKNGTYKANGANVTLPDGRQLFVGSSGTGAPEPK